MQCSRRCVALPVWSAFPVDATRLQCSQSQLRLRDGKACLRRFRSATCSPAPRQPTSPSGRNASCHIWGSKTGFGSNATMSLRVGFALAPRVVRRPVLRRPTWPWLKPEAHHALSDALAAQAATEPLAWPAHVDWVRRLQYLRVGLQSLGLLASDHDAEIGHPFLDRGFADALAALPRRERFSSRTAAMRALFGMLLPRQILERLSKTCFDQAFWSNPSRGFVLLGWRRR